MRKIKFRAWDIGQGGHMLPWEQIINTEYNFWWNNQPGNGWWRDPDLTLMQFTGLYDKNGKEIYEGDVLSPEIYAGKLKSYHFPVVFVDGVFVLEGKLAGFDTLAKSLRHGGKRNHPMIVIGNIYEHPHLLEDRK